MTLFGICLYLESNLDSVVDIFKVAVKDETESKSLIQTVVHFEGNVVATFWPPRLDRLEEDLWAYRMSKIGPRILLLT